MRHPLRTLVLLLVTVAAISLIAAGTAAAQPNALERGRTENEVARTLVDRSLEAAKAGDYDRAYALARTAYLDHYEYVEIPLRLRDPDLVLDTEFQFAELRRDLQDQRPLDTIRSDVRDVREGILATDRALAAKGVAAPAIAFGFSFSILFREGVEAVLLIAILLGSLAAGKASGYRKPLSLGVLGALAATAVDLGAGDARARPRAGQPRAARGDDGAVGGGRADRRQLLARRADRAAAVDGVHARTRGERRSPPAARPRSRCSASPPSTARASRRCSSTRRCCSSPTASGCGSRSERRSPSSRSGRSRTRSCGSVARSRSSRCSWPARRCCCCCRSRSPATPCARCRARTSSAPRRCT